MIDEWFCTVDRNDSISISLNTSRLRRGRVVGVSEPIFSIEVGEDATVTARLSHDVVEFELQDGCSEVEVTVSEVDALRIASFLQTMLGRP